MNVYTYQPLISELLVKIRTVIPSGIKIYLVGGAVRDLLLERDTHDLDFVILGGDVLRLSRRVANALGGAYYPLDIERETARIIIEYPDGQLFLDFSAPRGADLQNDLIARDFTINAIALDLDPDIDLIDPLHGARDLKDQILRACSVNSIEDDPVRLLRAVRQSLDYKLRITPETKHLIKQGVSKLDLVSIERLRDELFRILEVDQAASGIRLLDTLGALEYVLPELESLKGVGQPLPHRYNLWEHTLEVTQKLVSVLKALSEPYNPETVANWTSGLISLKLGRYREQIKQHLKVSISTLRPMKTLLLMAALYHDSGKPLTFQVDENKKIHFYGHASVGADLVSQRGSELRLSNGEVNRLRLIVRNHMRPLFLAENESPPTRRAIYRFFRDCGEAGVDVCLLSLADTLGTYGPELPNDLFTTQLNTVQALMSAYWENKEQYIAPPTLLNGNDLMEQFKLTPGPQIGELLEMLREAQVMGIVCDRQEALRFIETRLEE